MAKRVPRTFGAILAVAAVILLGGCAAPTEGEWKRIAMPDPASEQGHYNLQLWQGAWIAALVTGVIVWGLIFYALWRFRRRGDADIPVQTRYNLPLEIFYTIFPVLMCIVFFTHTVRVQNEMLDEGRVDNEVEVVGMQWSWVFNHGIGTRDADADESLTDDTYAYDSYAHESGTAQYIPTLYLPLGETTRFNLYSPDVIHDFGVPGFLMKMDVVPGRVNHYAITPTRLGDYDGRCYELCGVSHSRMLFHVKVVSPEDYKAYVDQLAETPDNVTAKPLLGGADAYTRAGLPEEGSTQEEGTQ